MHTMCFDHIPLSFSPPTDTGSLIPSSVSWQSRLLKTLDQELKVKKVQGLLKDSKNSQSGRGLGKRSCSIAEVWEWYRSLSGIFYLETIFVIDWCQVNSLLNPAISSSPSLLNRTFWEGLAFGVHHPYFVVIFCYLGKVLVTSLRSCFISLKSLLFPMLLYVSASKLPPSSK
jgi:hypothetical protein